MQCFTLESQKLPSYQRSAKTTAEAQVLDWNASTLRYSWKNLALSCQLQVMAERQFSFQLVAGSICWCFWINGDQRCSDCL